MEIQFNTADQGNIQENLKYKIGYPSTQPGRAQGVDNGVQARHEPETSQSERLLRNTSCL